MLFAILAARPQMMQTVMRLHASIMIISARLAALQGMIMIACQAVVLVYYQMIPVQPAVMRAMILIV